MSFSGFCSECRSRLNGLHDSIVHQSGFVIGLGRRIWDGARLFGGLRHFAAVIEGVIEIFGFRDDFDAVRKLCAERGGGC